MAQCTVCNDTKKCSVCGGTGSGKGLNPHPSPDLINPKTGEVKCYACYGDKKCASCK
jgi:hypothetical protein